MRFAVILIAAALAIGACGGGGSNDADTTTTVEDITTTTTTVNPSTAAIAQLQVMKDAATRIEKGLKATPTDAQGAGMGCSLLQGSLSRKAQLLGLSLPASAGNFIGKAVEAAQDLGNDCATGRLSGSDLIKAIGVEAQADLAVAVIRDPSKGVPVR